ncbi:MAG: hypothetical protein WBM86_08040 [Waterburya sp.]
MAIAIDYKESNPYAVRVTGRCGMILHIPRHDPYIKPIQNTHHWCNGIAVPIDHLVPVRINQEIFSTDINTENVENVSKVKFINDKPSLYS